MSDRRRKELVPALERITGGADTVGRSAVVTPRSSTTSLHCTACWARSRWTPRPSPTCVVPSTGCMAYCGCTTRWKRERVCPARVTDPGVPDGTPRSRTPARPERPALVWSRPSSWCPSPLASAHPGLQSAPECHRRGPCAPPAPVACAPPRAARCPDPGQPVGRRQRRRRDDQIQALPGEQIQADHRVRTAVDVPFARDLDRFEVAGYCARGRHCVPTDACASRPNATR